MRSMVHEPSPELVRRMLGQTTPLVFRMTIASHQSDWKTPLFQVGGDMVAGASRRVGMRWHVHSSRVSGNTAWLWNGSRRMLKLGDCL